ncbi:hypothetical protein R3P38DRAFT_2767605 [Favolaschia claudopus]|uniref:Uncharacterized protein n=1 Tax=Favolaschia claudopus TaxID=2862362 RepID=A0AAW0CWT3_9AGAR
MTSAAAPAPAKDWYAPLRRLSSEEFRDLKQIAIAAVAKQQDSDNVLRFLNNVRAVVTKSRNHLGDLRGCPPWLIALHYSLRTAVNLADPGQDYPKLRDMLLTKSEILGYGCPDTYLRDFTDVNASKQLPAEPSLAPPAAPPQTPKVTPVSDHPAGSKSRKPVPAKGPAQPGPSASTKSTKSGGGPRYGAVPKEVPQVVIITPAPASGSKRKAPDTPAEEEEPKGKKGKPAKAPASEGIFNIYQFLCEHNERARSGHDSDIEVIETKDAPKAPVAGPSRKAVPAPKAVKAGAKAPLPVSASVAVKDVSEAMLIQSILRSEDIIPVTTKIRICSASPASPESIQAGGNFASPLALRECKRRGGGMDSSGTAVVCGVARKCGCGGGGMRGWIGVVGYSGGVGGVNAGVGQVVGAGPWNGCECGADVGTAVDAGVGVGEVVGGCTAGDLNADAAVYVQIARGSGADAAITRARERMRRGENVVAVMNPRRGKAAAQSAGAGVGAGVMVGQHEVVAVAGSIASSGCVDVCVEAVEVEEIDISGRRKKTEIVEELRAFRRQFNEQ